MDLTKEELVALIKKANDFYYNKGEPFISDDLYDLAKDRLRQIDPKNPVIKDIGAPPQERKVALPFYMGSLDKIRDDPKQVERWYKKYPGASWVSDKLDGNSALYTVNSQGTAQLYSRGDGRTGQDLSHLLPYIHGLPREQPLAVRGELIISKKDWASISHKGANARNMVAGAMHSIKNIDSEVCSNIQFIAYELLSPRPDTPSKGAEILKTLGFTVVWNTLLEGPEITMETLSTILMKRRDESLFEIDGIVVYHNASHPLPKGQNPKYAFAMKTILSHTEAEVIVERVEWNISKDGLLKPIVHFPPVSLSGVTIKKATGFHGKFIEDNKIGVGSRIVIIRSGDVIPFIVRVLTHTKPMLPPPTPAWEWNENHVEIRLVHASSADDYILRQMEHFVTSLKVHGLGKGLLQKLFASGIDSIPKLLKITPEQLCSIEGFQKKLASKIVQELNAAMDRAECIDLMVASNSFGRGIARKKLELIIKANGLNSLEGLESIEGVGSATAKAFRNGLPIFYSFLETIGKTCELQPAAPTTETFKGLTVMFTGVRKPDWETAIIAGGGKVSTGVSKNTSLLVAKNPSESTGKVLRARELGIPVISIAEFANRYGLPGGQ